MAASHAQAAVLEVSVLLDRELGLITTVQVPRGATVMAVKEELCRSDPTGNTRMEDISLALADCSSGEPSQEPLRPLGDAELVTERLSQLQLLPTAFAAQVLELAPPETAPTAAPVANTSQPAIQPSAGAVLSEASAALARGASDVAANVAVRNLTRAIDSCKGAGGGEAIYSELLVARGLLFWRWSMLDRALQDLTEAYSVGKRVSAAQALLALRISLSQWPAAQQLAKELGQTAGAGLIDAWYSAAHKMQNLFFPQEAKYIAEEVDIVPGFRQVDARVTAAEGAQLGLRLLLRVDEDTGRPATARPLMLCFHGEDETVDTYAGPHFLDPLLAADASAVIAGFRGYGCSSGAGPSLVHLRVDGDCVCDALPGILAEKGLPWPWPGKLVLYGNSLGSRVACYLAGVRGENFFNGGLILESAWCGSYAPGAKPLPEPPKHMALAAMGSNSVVDSRFGSRELNITSGALGRFCVKLLDAAGTADCGHFCYVRGNEDLIRGFGGRLLILHGEVDHVIPADHARRLCDAAEAATRRLVLVPGKRYDSLRLGPSYVEALRKFLEGQ